MLQKKDITLRLWPFCDHPWQVIEHLHKDSQLCETNINRSLLIRNFIHCQSCKFCGIVTVGTLCLLKLSVSLCHPGQMKSLSSVQCGLPFPDSHLEVIVFYRKVISIKSPPTATVSTEHRVKSRTLKQQSKRQTCRARADLGKGYFLIIRAQMKPKVSHYSLSQRIPEWGLYAFKHTARLRFGRAQPDYGYPEATRQDIVVWIKSHSGHRKGAQKDTDLLRSHVQTGIIPLAVPTSGFHKFFYERRVCHNLVKMLLITMQVKWI